MRAWLSVLVGAVLPVVRHMSMSPDSSGEVSHDVAKEPPATSSRPKPCDDCRHKARCAREQIGCHALVLFMHHASPTRWGYAPRQPSRELFEQAMTPVKIKAPAVYRRPADEDDEEMA